MFFLVRVLITTLISPVVFSCRPGLTYMSAFDPLQFEGDWYVLRRHIEPAVEDCNKIHYKWNGIARQFTIHDTYKNNDTAFDYTTYLYEDPNFLNQGKYITSAASSIGASQWTRDSFRRDYNFAATDYKSYAVIMHCMYKFRNNFDVVVLARTPDFDISSVTGAIQDILNTQTMPLDKLKVIDHSHCTIGLGFGLLPRIEISLFIICLVVNIKTSFL